MYKAKYSAESEIPADVKAFYVLKGGEWVFEGSKFDGLAEMLNPALEANKNQILEEKRRAVEAKDTAEARVKTQDTEITRLEGEVKKLQQPGTVAISDADNKMFSEYKELGAPKDIKDKLANEVQLSTKVANIETKEEIRTLAKKLSLNEDALIDFKLNNERGKDLKLQILTQKEKDSNGKEVEKELLAVVTTEESNGKTKDTVTEFSKYATEKDLPTYLVDAIYNTEKNGDQKSRSNFRTPASMQRKTETKKEDESLVQTRTKSFNDRRSTREMPWMKKQKSD